MPLQLALDEVLLNTMVPVLSVPGLTIASTYEPGTLSTGTPLIRFYFSDSPWVSLGYSKRGFKRSYAYAQHPRDDFKNWSAYPTVRRITGGGRVFHKDDIIFSIVAPKEADESFMSVRMSYLKIHEAVKLAFESCGMNTRFYRCDENLPKGEDCFQFPIATDLAFGKKKVAGGAQKRTRGVMLHQESIAPPEKMEALAFIEKLKIAFAKVFFVELAPADLDIAWMNQAKRLAKDKYETGKDPESEELMEMAESLDERA